MQKFKEIWDLTTAVIRWGSLAIGGVCLLAVCVTTGWFPEDMTVGEGVALYFIFVGFLLVYAAYWLGVTSVGLLALRWPMEWLDRFDKRAPSHAMGYALSNFKLMWSLPVWVVAAVAGVYVASIRFDFAGAILYGGIIILQGFFGGLFLVLRRRLQFDASGLSLSDHTRSSRHPKSMTEIRQVMYSILAALIVLPVIPIVLGQNHDALISSAFRLAQLSKDHATVHVALPWSQRLTEAGLTPRESFLGTNYARFEDVTVRMRSIGSRVVLEVAAPQRKTQFINIPRQVVEVE